MCIYPLLPPVPNAQTVLELTDVRLQKGDYVILDDINWKVQHGQMWIIKGYNGAGKSSVIRLILVRQTNERVFFVWICFAL